MQQKMTKLEISEKRRSLSLLFLFGCGRQGKKGGLETEHGRICILGETEECFSLMKVLQSTLACTLRLLHKPPEQRRTPSHLFLRGACADNLRVLQKKLYRRAFFKLRRCKKPRLHHGADDKDDEAAA